MTSQARKRSRAAKLRTLLSADRPTGDPLSEPLALTGRHRPRRAGLVERHAALRGQVKERLPLIALLFSVYQFMAMPMNNTIIRTTEYEADIFGINASRQPDGFASVALKLGEYRKLDPGPIEEIIFFDHPSGRTRIFSAMRWKAENLLPR